MKLGHYSSLCNLCALCVSVVFFDKQRHHRDTEHTEVARRKLERYSNANYCVIFLIDEHLCISSERSGAFGD